MTAAAPVAASIGLGVKDALARVADAKHLTADEMADVVGLIMDGAELVALQHNRYWRRADGLALDVGAYAAALEYATRRDAVVVGKPAEAFPDCAAVAAGVFETAFVEHAYIEPEAGWAKRVGDRIEVHVTTQTPYMNRDEVANVMRLRP